VFDMDAIRRIYDIVHGTLSVFSLEFSSPIGVVIEEIIEAKEFSALKYRTFIRNSHTLIVNRDWYENAEEKEIKFFLRYEAMHLYQKEQIEKMRGEAQTSIDEGTKNLWEDKNKWEIDAYAFAVAIEAIEITEFPVDMKSKDIIERVLKNVEFKYVETLSTRKIVEGLAQKKIRYYQYDLVKYHDFFTSQYLDVLEK